MWVWATLVLISKFLILNILVKYKYSNKSLLIFCFLFSFLFFLWCLYSPSSSSTFPFFLPNPLVDNQEWNLFGIHQPFPRPQPFRVCVVCLFCAFMSDCACGFEQHWYSCIPV